MRFRPLALAACLIAIGATAAPAAEPLARLGADPAQVSVSGISSGAFMANQLHMAHSAGIMGVGLVAGGLYGCAVDSIEETGVRSLASTATGACMATPNRLLPADDYAQRARRFAALGWIDPIENLGRSRLYAFTGRADSVVSPRTVDRAVAVYGLLGLPTVATSFSDEQLNAGHSWVTQRFGGACSVNAPPYINDCNYDQAGQVLSTIYGPLQPRAARATGRFAAFDQREFAPAGAAAANGLWDTGMVYVPAACQGSAARACRLHMVLHGCKQSIQTLGDTFYRNIGVNEWADTNRIIVLYPQARTVSTTDFARPRATDLLNTNPNGCWNWWGYAYDARYPFKDGVQVSALWAMMQRATAQP